MTATKTATKATPIKRSVTRERVAHVAKRPNITVLFKNWRGIKDEVEVLGNRQEELRSRLLAAVEGYGETDEKGNQWLDFPTPIEFTDHDGRTYQYTALKRERHLTPANPTPDPEKVQDLLEKKGLWFSEKQTKQFQDLQLALPFLRLKIEVDVDAVGKAYFAGLITEAEYEACLREQKESFQFRPVES